MLARKTIQTSGKFVASHFVGRSLRLGGSKLGVVRMFSVTIPKTTEEKDISLDQKQSVSEQKIQLPTDEVTAQPTTEEYLYKNKIIQEVIKEPLLEDHGTSQEIKAAPNTPEKDKAFVQKKTTLWQKIKVGLVHLKDSFKDVWKDTKYLSKVVYRNGVKENEYTLFEMRERRRITKDLIKFMPYAVLIILPGGELLFPIYVLLFPNSTPTQFMTVANLGERTKHMTEKQAEGYENFVRSLPKFTTLLGIDPIKLYESLNHLDKTEGKEKDRQFYKAHDFEEKIQKFLKLKNKDELIAPIGLSS